MKLPAFRPREKFLMLEITPEGTSGLFLSIDDKKRVTVEKIAKGIDLKKFIHSPKQKLTQKSWEGEHLVKSRRKIIATAHPSLATTIPVPLELPRDRGVAKREILLSEVENLIAQAMGKVFNQCRGEAAKRLNVYELDAILVGARARHFKIDGRSVMNPVGFPGKKISLLLELVFTRRDLFEDLKMLFNAPDGFFFAEGPQARLAYLARDRALPLNLVVGENGASRLFILENVKGEHPVLYRETLAWDPGALVGSIADAIGVSAATARGLYERYRAGDMSDASLRAFKKVLDPVIDGLLREIKKSGVRGPVYLDLPHELPFALPHRESGVSLEEPPVASALAAEGYLADEADFAPYPPGFFARHVLPFLEAQARDADLDINQKLRRRLHWLAE